MSLINCEINLILTWSEKGIITNSTGKGTFAITNAKLYVPVATLSIQLDAKLLQQLKSDFKGKNMNQRKKYKCQTHI